MRDLVRARATAVRVTGNQRQLMAYLGLTPSEHSSGTSVRRGGIIKAGIGLARRALIEGVWSYRMQARVCQKLFVRLEALPQAVHDIAWKGQLRMCHRYRCLMVEGKPKVVATTAIAREWRASSRGVTTMQSCPSSGQLSVQTIAAETGLVAQMEPTPVAVQLLGKLRT